MKKQISAILLAILMVASLSAANAAEASTPAADDGPVMRSSDLLVKAIIGIDARSNHLIITETNIYAKTTMDKLGVLTLQIQKNVNGTWSEYQTLYSSDHPEFLSYNTNIYSGDYSFYGSKGDTYRAVITAVARKGDQMETRVYNSSSVVCT